MPVGFQVGIRLTDWVLSGASVDLDFVNNRFFGSSGGSLSSYLTISRASVANAKNSSGAWVQFPTDTLRITDLGLLTEDTRTNNLLQSEAPATQTTASLVTGSYTLWIEGSGSALASGGSATITGAASASDGLPNTFSVTVAGTVVVTVTGSLTRFQLENGNFSSSYIQTTGTTATRAADAVTLVGPADTLLDGAAVSVVDDVKTIVAVSGGVNSNNPFLCQSPAATQPLRTNTFNNQITSIAADGNEKEVLIGNSRTFGVGVKIATSWDAGGRSIVGGGGSVGTDAHTMASGTWLIGQNSGGRGNFLTRRLTMWNSRLPDATLQALTL